MRKEIRETWPLYLLAFVLCGNNQESAKWIKSFVTGINTDFEVIIEATQIRQPKFRIIWLQAKLGVKGGREGAHVDRTDMINGPRDKHPTGINRLSTVILSTGVEQY
jgi:hypothetical protein